MKKMKVAFTVIRILAYISIFLFFAIVSPSYIEGESYCQWYNNFGLVCSTCGFTRGFTYFMHGHIGLAFMYNPFLVIFAIPAFLFIVLQDIYTVIKRNILKIERMSFIEFIVRPDIYLGK